MHRTSRFFLLFFSCLPLFFAAALPTLAQTAAGKPLTVERIYSGPSLSGSLTQGIEWTPDGTRISYLRQNPQSSDGGEELWTMDASTGERKVVVKADTLAAVMQPEKTAAIQATGLGRIQAENYLWSPRGDSLLFIGSNTLVMLDLKTSRRTADRERRIRPGGSQILAGPEMDQLRARLQSLGRKSDPGRLAAIDGRRHRRSPEGQARLGLSGRARLQHGVLVVSRFLEDRLLRNGRAARHALSHHGHEFPGGRAANTPVSRRRVKRIPSCAWA